MNRSGVIDDIATRTGLLASDIGMALDGLRDVLAEALTRGDKVTLPGLLTVERVARAPREGRNPQTGEAISIPAGYAAKVSVGEGLQRAAKAGASPQ